MPPRFLLAGGGTGGHLFPALSVAEVLDKKGAAVIFVGTRHGVEAEIIPKRNFPIEFLWLSGFKRARILANLLLPLKVIISLIQSWIILMRYRPKAALGTGGYVCGPILLVTALFRIPFYLQEQNSYPGVTTRLLSRYAQGIFLNFAEAAKYLSHPEKCHHVGNPVRTELARLDRPAALEKLGLNPELPTLLVFGGSQGALRINSAVREALTDLSLFCNLIWGRGKLDLSEPVEWQGAGKLVMQPFIEDMATAYAAADLVTCRSGAMTLSELTAAQLPAILIPYPFAAGDHQRHNANSFVQLGGAVMIEDLELTGERLLTEVRSLLQNRSKLEEMRRCLAAIPQQNTAEIIAETLLQTAGFRPHRSISQ